MWPDRVSNPGPPTYESGALPIALCGPAIWNAQPMKCTLICNVRPIWNVHPMKYTPIWNEHPYEMNTHMKCTHYEMYIHMKCTSIHGLLTHLFKRWNFETTKAAVNGDGTMHFFTVIPQYPLIIHYSLPCFKCFTCTVKIFWWYHSVCCRKQTINLSYIKFTCSHVRELID